MEIRVAKELLHVQHWLEVVAVGVMRRGTVKSSRTTTRPPTVS